MKIVKRILVLTIAIAMLLIMGGYAEEQGGAELTLMPVEGMETLVDEALKQKGMEGGCSFDGARGAHA